MKFILDVRYGRHDQWTQLEFDSREAMDNETLYKVNSGWEVRLNENSADPFA
jgi:hypothetical protein